MTEATTKYLPDSELFKYNLCDLHATRLSFDRLRREGACEMALFDHAMTGPALTMSLRGLRVDESAAAAVLEETWDDGRRLRRKMDRIRKFDWTGKAIKPKPHELAAVLYDELRAPVQSNRDGGRTVNKEALDAIINSPKSSDEAVTIAAAALELTRLEEDRKVIEKPRGRDGRFHTGMGVATTVSSRWSSRKDAFNEGGNLHAMNRRVRRIFIADDGCVLVNRDLSQAESYCLTADHEVLTENGWVGISDVTRETQLACWYDDRTMCWAAPAAVIKKTTRKLIEVEGRSLAFRATPEHRVPYYTCQGNVRVKPAEQLGVWEDVPVNGLLGAGENVMELDAQLAAAFHADGSFNGPTSAIFRFRKTRKIDRMRALLTLSTYRWRELKQKNSTCFAVYGAPNFARWGKSLDWFALSWCLQARQAYLAEMVHWDGHRPKRHINSFNFTSGKPREIEVATAMAHISGWKAAKPTPDSRNSEVQTIMLCSNAKTSSMATAERRTLECGETDVFCLTVPGSFFMIRHKGRISITGNCVAYLANDERYKAAHRSGNLHMYVGNKLWPHLKLSKDKAKTTPVPWNPDIQWYDLFKRRGHAANYLQTAWGFARLAHIPVAEAKRSEALYFGEFPGIRQWHKEVEYQIKTFHRLTTPMGRVRQFLGRHWDHSTIKEGVAHTPQSTISDINKVILWRIWSKLDPILAMLLLEVHDSNLCQVRERDVGEFIEVTDEMAKVEVPIGDDVMVIGSSVSVGNNWGDWDPKRNPRGLK